MGINYNKDRIAIVDVKEVRPNPWNPKDKNTEEYRRVKSSIETNGLKIPIIVRENKGYEVIDGEQRLRACRELKYQKVLIYNEGKITDQRAKELTIWYQQQVPFNEVDLASLIKDLTQYPEINLPFPAEEIDDYLKMADFDWDKFKDIEPPDFDKIKTMSISVTAEQYEIIKKAVEKMREKEGNEDISEGRVLELISGDYLASE